MSTPDKILIDESTLAPLIGVSVSFLQKDRRKKRLVPFVMLGNNVRYHLPSVQSALLALEQGGNATMRQTAKRGAA